jgi:hypothetical protein
VPRRPVAPGVQDQALRYRNERSRQSGAYGRAGIMFPAGMIFGLDRCCCVLVAAARGCGLTLLAQREMEAG